VSRVLILPATPDHVDDISGILQEAEAWLREAGMPMWLAEELRADRLRRDVEAGMHYLAEVDGENAGTLRFQLEDEEYWPDLPSGDSAFVHRLAVRPRFAGTGVGAALLDWAADRAKELGRHFLRLDCDRDRPRLRAFYERNGFRHHSDRQVGPFLVARYERSLR
jgi:GNAT superfamily N-acetyltransferase